MDNDDSSKFIDGIHNLSIPLVEVIKDWVDSCDEDLRIPLFALSKASAIHIQSMVIGLELDEQEKEKLVQLFIGSIRAALTDLHGFVQSEEVINKMMGKSCD
jgi:hypothetical protein